MIDLYLIPVAFITSVTAAIGGIAGGVILISAMPGLIPAAAIVPVHGFVQISSNVSRAVLSFGHIEWPIVRVFTLGAILGALVGAHLVSFIVWEQYPLFLGLFLLVITWLPRIENVPQIPGRFFALGAFQTAVSLFVGVGGPINLPFLLREDLGHDRTVITHAVQMTSMHVLKVLTFGVLGFSFVAYWKILAGMVVAAIAGSWVGTHLRGYVPERIFSIALRIMITLLALRMILKVLGANIP